MKIYIINPDYGMTREEMDSRCGLLQRYAAPDTELFMDCLARTKVELNSARDAVLAGPEILSMAEAAEAGGASAVILYCFSDPAAEACRESLSIPVVGGAQAACCMVPLMGRRAGVLLADPRRIQEKELFLRSLGLSGDRIAAVDAVDFRGRSVWEDRDGALRALLEKGKELRRRGADVLVLGCLSFLGLGHPLSEALGIPVIDPAAAAVALAEALVRQR